MTVMSLRDAIDGARAIRFSDDGTAFVAWFGGTTYNVYADVSDGIQEVDVFSLSDDKGRPVDQQRAEDKAAEIAANLGP